MELIAALYGLYALHCVVWLPGGAWLFVPTPFGWVISKGPGFRLLHPRPAARSAVATHFPLVERDGRIFGHDGATWLSRRGLGDAGPIEREALSGATAHGSVVRIERRRLARSGDAAEAERIAGLLREVAAAEPEGARRRIADELARAGSIAGFRAARDRFDADTRLLAWTSDIYASALLVLLPCAMSWWGSERALVLCAPALLALHLTTVFALARAHHRLFPERRGARLETLLGAAVYPPGLLRALQQLRMGALASFGPAAVASAILPAARSHAWLRGELVRSALHAGPVEHMDGLDLARLERDALHRLIRELGESPEALLAAPARVDPLAESYCPACRSEYRRAGGRCLDCDAALEAYGAGADGVPGPVEGTR